MTNARIARRYAKALLSIGTEDGQADTYKKELKDVVDLFEAYADLDQAVNNPLYSREDRKRVLEAVIERIGPSQVVSSFLLLLFDKGRMPCLKDIYGFYEKLTDEAADIVRALVESAVALPEETVEKITAALSEKTGKKVLAETRVDPALIGGVVTKIGDLVLDGSVKTQLIGLKESLQRGEGI